MLSTVQRFASMRGIIFIKTVIKQKGSDLTNIFYQIILQQIDLTITVELLDPIN